MYKINSATKYVHNDLLFPTIRKVTVNTGEFISVGLLDGKIYYGQVLSVDDKEHFWMKTEKGETLYLSNKLCFICKAH